MKMKKLSEEHYIVMDDSDIKIGDIVAEKLLTGKYELFTIHTLNDIDKSTQIKITYSTQPESLGMGWMQSVQPLLLSEVKELLGVVDVKKKAEGSNGYALYGKPNGEKYLAFREGFIVGYNQALQDNKEKKYTEEDMRKAMRFGSMRNKLTISELESSFQQLIQSIQPTEWEVEMVDGKLKLK